GRTCSPVGSGWSANQVVTRSVVASALGAVVSGGSAPSSSPPLHASRQPTTTASATSTERPQRTAGETYPTSSHLYRRAPRDPGHWGRGAGTPGDQRMKGG